MSAPRIVLLFCGLIGFAVTIFHRSQIPLAAAVFAAVLSLPSPSSAQDQTSAKWGPHLDLEGKAGTDRNLGETDLFVPLLQDDDTLFFTSLRTRMDDSNSREGNFGLGIRHMLESGWNLGGIAYFDRRKTEWGNYFNQVTLGAEALSTNWDFRANAYIPQGRTAHDVDSLSDVSISGSSIMFYDGEERSMKGFDAEIGWRLPLFDATDAKQFRLFAGGYHFFETDLQNITGPRFRGEMTFDEVPWLWEGSRFSLGSEWQHDKPRGSQGFITARLRIPLQFFGTSPSKLSPMERRMTDPVIRDIDVVSQSGTFGPGEEATTTADGESITVANSNEIASTAALNTLLSNAGSGTVILSGNFTATATVNMPDGQTLIGGGAVTVKTPSGKTATLALDNASISSSESGVTSGIVMGNNTTLRNMNVSYSENAAGGFLYTIVATAKTGIVIENSTITSYGNTLGSGAIHASSGSDITIRNNTITGKSDANQSIGVNVSNSSNVTIANNTFSNQTTGTKYVVVGNAATSFTNDSTGNSSDGGSCNFVIAPTGSVGFDAINCP